MISPRAKTVDRRVARTRGALRDAFHALMAERGWDDVNVQSICQRADIGRSTFYVHFRSKEELLDAELKDLRKTFRRCSTRDKRGVPEVLSFLRRLIEHAQEQRALFRGLIGRRSGYVVHRRFRAFVLELVREDLSQFAATWQRDAVAHCLTGALVEVLTWLAETRHAVRADEIEREFRRSILPSVTLLKRAGR